MGKFGSFKVNDILDQPYGHSYEVLSKGMIRRASPKELDGKKEGKRGLWVSRWTRSLSHTIARGGGMGWSE